MIKDFEAVKELKELYSVLKVKDIKDYKIKNGVFMSKTPYFILSFKNKKLDDDSRSFLFWINDKTTNIEIDNLFSIKNSRVKDLKSISSNESNYVINYFDNKAGVESVFSYSKKYCEETENLYNRIKEIEKKMILEFNLDIKEIKLEIFEKYLDKEENLVDDITDEKILEIPSGKIYVGLKDMTSFKLKCSSRDSEERRYVILESENENYIAQQIFLTI